MLTHNWTSILHPFPQASRAIIESEKKGCKSQNSGVILGETTSSVMTGLQPL